MTKQRKAYLSAQLGVPIVVNQEADQRIIDYDNAQRLRSRQLKQSDHNGDLEWVSYHGLIKQVKEIIYVSASLLMKILNYN